MVQEFRFRVNLLHDGNTHQNADEVLAIANTKSIYLPIGGSSLPVKKLKHGDVFTLRGLQGAQLKKLIESSRIVNIEMDIDAVEETEGELQLTGLTRYGFYTVTMSDSFVSVGGQIYAFNADDFSSFDLESIGDIRFTSDGEFVYVLMVADNEEESGGDFRLAKIDSLGEVTLIDVPYFGFEYEVRKSISDGGDDMYDNGNYLNTNLALEIPYVHSPNSSDGAVTDGTSYFGEGSQYFTNNNDSVFSMVATNIAITSFSISGNLGADHGGSRKSGRLVVSVGGHDFSVFYRCVYGAGDPSVNHLIIIPGDHDLTHNVDNSTDIDGDEVTGLDVASRIAYILYAKNDGAEASEDELEDVAEEFIGDTGFRTNSISAILSGLNSSDLASNISNIYDFDDGDGAETAGGLTDLDSMIYIGDDKLAILNDQHYVVITTTGEQLVDRSSDAFESFSELVYFDDQVYGFGFSNVIYHVNKDTGVVFGEGDLEDKKSNILNWKEDSAEQFEINGISLPFVSNNRLFAIAYADFSAIIEVFPDTNEISFISWFTLDELYGISEIVIPGNESDEIGLSTSVFTDFYSYYWDGVIWANENLFHEEPTVENLVLQWADDGEFEDGEPTWQSVDIVEINFTDPAEDRRWLITFTPPETEDSYVLRMRYVDGELWHYIGED